jgi:hypothetical protein
MYELFFSQSRMYELFFSQSGTVRFEDRGYQAQFQREWSAARCLQDVLILHTALHV